MFDLHIQPRMYERGRERETEKARRKEKDRDRGEREREKERRERERGETEKREKEVTPRWGICKPCQPLTRSTLLGICARYVRSVVWTRFVFHLCHFTII